MIKLYFAILISVFLCKAVHAESLTQAAPECACDSKVIDTLEEPIKFAFGKFDGQCINTCRFRRARILNDSNGDLLVANILHDGKYYKGQIPTKNFSEIEIGFEVFAPMGISHVFYKFNLAKNAPDLELTEQTTNGQASLKTRSIVLSAEGVPPKDHKYSLIESYFGHYLVVTKMTSAEEMSRWTKIQKHSVTFYKMKLTPEQAAHVFAVGIHDSDSNGFRQKYQLFSNNCSTTSLKWVNEVLHSCPAPGTLAYFEVALSIAGPLGTKRQLTELNLIDPNSPQQLP